MKISKYGHSCLLAEVNDVRVLVDVGTMNTEPGAVGVDAILITHEHPDHFDLPKLKNVLARNPEAIVITHEAVGTKLTEASISHKTIEPGEKIEIKGVPIESYGTDHAIIFGSTSPCRNSGFLINRQLYIPGDALHDVPPTPVEILALPTGGPWMKLSETLAYAKLLKPKIVFPIHDAMYTDIYRESFIPRFLTAPLESEGIKFITIKEGSSETF